MQHYTGKIETLGEAHRAGRNLMGECCSCGHMRGFSPYALRSDLGRDMKIADVAKLMRCRRCGTRAVRLAYNRNVVEAHMERLRQYPEFLAMCAPLQPPPDERRRMSESGPVSSAAQASSISRGMGSSPFS